MFAEISSLVVDFFSIAFQGLTVGGGPLAALIFVSWLLIYSLGKSHGSNKSIEFKFQASLNKIDGLLGKLHRMEDSLNHMISSHLKNLEVVKEKTVKAYEILKRLYKSQESSFVKEVGKEEQQARINVDDIFKGSDSSEQPSGPDDSSSQNGVGVKYDEEQTNAPTKSIWQRLRSWSLFSGGSSSLDSKALQDKLLAGELGWELTNKIVSELSNIKDVDVSSYLRGKLKSMLKVQAFRFAVEQKPRVILFLGVNGVGKTSSLAKLGKILKTKGFKVLAIAADTFRAGAEEQLKIWCDKLGLDCHLDKLAQKPQTVVFDGLKRAIEQSYDFALIDLAGRLHNKSHLLQEINGLKKVIFKLLPDHQVECILVVDATTGQTAFNQARDFNEVVSISSIIVTKLDTSFKGGVLFRICSELGLPVAFVSIGEDENSLIPLEPEEFVERVVA